MQRYIYTYKRKGRWGIKAKIDAKVLGGIGTGLQAFSQVLAIQGVREIEKLVISNLNKESVEKFRVMIEDIKNRDFEIGVADSNDALAEQSDMICTCTPAHTPVFD